MLVGQPLRDFGPTNLGAWTDPFKKIGKTVYKAHVVGTRVLVKAAKNPNVQKAAAQSAQAYAQQKYPEQYAKGAGYVEQAKAIYRPPQPQAPGMPQQMAPQQEEMAEDAPMPGGGPVQKGNFTTLALIGGAAVLLLIMMKK